MGAIRPEPHTGIDYFDISVNTGVRWLSLNDHLNYIVAGASRESTTYTRRRFTVDSSMYDGSFEVHSVVGGVNEDIAIDVLGSDQNMVTENYLALTEAFSQSLYNVRLTIDNHVETWTCFPADFVVDRGMLQAHNVRSQVRMSIPRAPKVSYEVLS